MLSIMFSVQGFFSLLIVLGSNRDELTDTSEKPKTTQRSLLVYINSSFWTFAVQSARLIKQILTQRAKVISAANSTEDCL